jgi:hypothetical protein
MEACTIVTARLSKTAYYNSFVEFWDECFVKTFGLVCSFFETDSNSPLCRT